MKLAVTGTGKIVQEVLPVLKQLPLEKCTICGRSSSREKTERLQKQYHLDEAYTDFDDVLASDADTVYIALPNTLHCAWAVKALQAGKHVIVEKPAAVNRRQLEEMTAAAEASGRMLFEAMNIHDLPAYRSMRDQLKDIGRIRIVSLNYSQYSSRYDAFKEGVITPAFDPACAGGALMDLNVYNIHFALGMFGMPEDVRYYPNMDRGIDTSGILIMNYPDFQVSAVGAKDCAAPMLSVIQGDAGSLMTSESVNFMESFRKESLHGTSQTFEYREEKSRLFYEFKTFIHAVDTGDRELMQQRLQLSRMAADVLDTARRTAGIIFPCELETESNIISEGKPLLSVR